MSAEAVQVSKMKTYNIKFGLVIEKQSIIVAAIDPDIKECGDRCKERYPECPYYVMEVSNTSKPEDEYKNLIKFFSNNGIPANEHNNIIKGIANTIKKEL